MSQEFAVRDGYVEQLADTVERIALLAEQLGLQTDELMDVWKLSLTTGVSPQHVRELLAGQRTEEFPPEWIHGTTPEEREDQIRKLRVRDRFQMLRETRRKGSPWESYGFASLDEIAASNRLTDDELSYLVKSVRDGVGNLMSYEEIGTKAGYSRQTISKLFVQKDPHDIQMPTYLTADKITAVFGVPEGFLSRSPEDALRDALKSVVQSLTVQLLASAPAEQAAEPMVVSARWRRDPDAPDLDKLAPKDKALAFDFLNMLIQRASQNDNE
ncbi:helix-turn-helix transcriptional regulator [Streptomyces sp. NPDC002812]|uniref:helix-turn-helix domain-containing protein n=1 Tax=Streptomyces sp. NPDC002812 TaxID=3154434 RepID=UPI00331C0E07